ncbi:MAG: membrane protein insertion efficiency factor YidD [Clostridiales bacterium]|nr:membrane protein insertion efficiency factor YidD [Clostridiales bacterium]
MLKFLSIKLIKFYQRFLSKGTCMYIPTCSQYTLEAIEKHGFFYGWCLGIFRILRCTPWCKGGFDKVPDKKRDLKWVY